MVRRIPHVHLVPVIILCLLVFAGLSLQPRLEAAEPVAQTETPHSIEGKEDCLMCHKAGGVKPVPAATHASYDNKMCLMCHKVAASGAQPTLPPAQPTAAPAQATHPPRSRPLLRRKQRSPRPPQAPRTRRTRWRARMTA